MINDDRFKPVDTPTTRARAVEMERLCVQSNLFITDTKGTGISVRVIEVSVLERKALYGFRSLRDQVNCP